MKLGNFFPFFLAPEGDASSPAPAAHAVESPISAENSPTGAPIPMAPSKQDSAPVLLTKQPGIVNPRKAFGLEKSPKDELDAEAKEITKRTETSVNIPVPKAKKTPPPKEDPKGKEVAPPKAEDKPPEPKVDTAAPVVAKIKIGDKEMTPEEVAKHIADLEAKAAAPKPEAKIEPPKAAEPAKPALTPEQEAADLAQKEQAMVKANIAARGMKQEVLNKIIADGDPDALNTHIEKVLFDERKNIFDQLNPIIEELFAARDAAKGPMEHFAQIQQYQDETKFFANNDYADLKPHQTQVRKIAGLMKEKYPEQWKAMSEDQRHADIAVNTRNFLKEMGVTIQPAPSPNAATAAVVAPPAPAAPVEPPKPKAPQPKPPTGNLGGAGAPATVNKQKSLISQLENYRR